MKTIGIDIGTTSVSSVVMDNESGMQVASKTLPNDTAILGKPWERQQDPNQIFEKCRALLDGYKKEWPDIGRAGITGQMHGMLYVNAEGEAISPLVTWEDERGSQFFRDGRSYVEELCEVTGYPMATGFGLTTHYYNLQNGLVPADAAYMMTIMDYVAMRFTGMKRPVSHASNAASFGLFDIETCQFDSEACNRAGIDRTMLPEVIQGERMLGTTDNGIQIAVPIGDNQAGILGLVRESGDVVLNIGTSSQISMVSDSIRKESDLDCRPYVGGKYLLLGAGLCGGTSFRMLNRFFREVIGECSAEISESEMFRCMTQAAENAYKKGGGLKVATQFRGKRSDPKLRGSISGIDMTNFTPGNLTLGFYRGVCEEMFDAYKKMGADPEKGQLLLCGNALRNNDLLRTLCKEIFGRAGQLMEQKEETAVGAAKLAMSLP